MIFILENVSENVVCQVVAILSQPQFVVKVSGRQFSIERVWKENPTVRRQ